MVELTESEAGETKEVPLNEIINDIYKKLSDIQSVIGYLLDKINVDKTKE